LVEAQMLSKIATTGLSAIRPV